MQVICINKIIMDIKILGLKNTKARGRIIELIKGSISPVDATTTMRTLRAKGISVDQATIYRALNLFVEKGLLKEIYFNDGVVRYELAEKPEHHHAVCIKCSRVEDITDCSVDKIEKQIGRKKGFTVLSHSLEFFGYCKNCKSKKS